MKLEGHYVYRCYDEAGRLLYVGHSGDLRERASAHRKFAAWWPLMATTRLVGPFPSKEAARAAERAAIEREAPRHNTQCNVNAPTLTDAERRLEVAQRDYRQCFRYGYALDEVRARRLGHVVDRLIAQIKQEAWRERSA